jgi:hypothetical protein
MCLHARPTSGGVLSGHIYVCGAGGVIPVDVSLLFYSSMTIVSLLSFSPPQLYPHYRYFPYYFLFYFFLSSHIHYAIEEECRCTMT